ncbi:MAG: porin [bacterium]
MLQGTEPASSSARAKIWGFIQPEYQGTSGSELAAGPWKGQDAAFNQIAPDLESDSNFQLRRARLGVRGTGFPLDSRVNYFLLVEAGNNGITKPGGGTGSVKVTDASVTLNYIDGARIRLGQFKYPGSEEGLMAIHVFNYINFTNATNFLTLERFFDEDGSRTGLDKSVANGANGPVGAFRDIGVQVFDTFKSDKWEHSYAAMIGNGNGIARSDNNNDKDFYLYWSSELVYGGKGPRRGGWKMFAWYQDGTRTLDYVGGVSGEQDFDRTRWGLGTTYLKDKVRFAAEYFDADGMIFNGTDGGAVPGSINNPGTSRASFNMLPEDSADGWYVDFGYKVHPKLELDARYDHLNRATDTKTGEREFRTFTVGAQWFFNKKARVIANYEFREAEAPGLPSAHGANKILGEMDDRFSVQVLAIF